LSTAANLLQKTGTFVELNGHVDDSLPDALGDRLRLVRERVRFRPSVSVSIPKKIDNYFHGGSLMMFSSSFWLLLWGDKVLGDKCPLFLRPPPPAELAPSNFTVFLSLGHKLRLQEF